MLRSKKLILLGVVGALVLIVATGGFALTRGYLMRFNVNEERISRETFYQYADEAMTADDFTLGCAQGEPAIGWLYIYEINCFDTAEAVEAYMATRYPR